MASRSCALRSPDAGDPRQRAACGESRLRHLSHQADRTGGRRGRNRCRGRSDVAVAAGRLRQQSELAACRRSGLDGGTGGRAPFPRSAVGRHHLHRAGGSPQRVHRELVAVLCADHHRLCAVVARRRAGNTPAAGPAQSLDTDACNHSAPSGHDRATCVGAGRAVRERRPDPGHRQRVEAFRIDCHAGWHLAGCQPDGIAQPDRPQWCR